MMKTRGKRLLVVLLVMVLTQLSCHMNSEDVDLYFQATICRISGGVWHEEYKDGDWERWCEEKPATRQPTATSRNPAQTATSAITATFDIARCDAREYVTVEAVLGEDNITLGGRNCWYTLKVTNNSAENVAFYVYENRANNDGSVGPRWWMGNIDAGTSHEFPGHGTFWTGGEWSYTYLERAAAVFYNDYCGYSGLGIDYNDEAGTAEQFAWPVDEVLCIQ